MKNNKIKKIISISLCAALLMPSVINATNLDDIIMSTSSSAGTWSDPLGGGTYIYGGDFKMKLKHSSSVAPIFQFRMPSMKTGCSGISIHGGFLSYLGLDKLQDALSDAGSSLMFGIFLGMEFSLPAVASVFAKIRAWANALQGLLQNGCNIGRVIGSGLGKELKLDALSNDINDSFKKMEGHISSDGDNSLLKKMEELAKCNGQTNDPNCKLATSLIGSVASELKNAAKASPSSAAADSSATKKLVDDGIKQTASEISKVFTLDTFYSTKAIGCSSASYNNTSDENIFIDAMKFIFFGEVGADDEVVKFYEDLIDDSTCKFKVREVSEIVASSITTGSDSLIATPKYARITPIIADEKDAAQMLVYGFSKINEKYPQVNGNIISIPNRKVLFLNLPLEKSADNDNATRAGRFIYVSNQPLANSAYSFTWDGAFKQSLKGIRDLARNVGGNNYAATTTFEEYDTSGISNISIPLLLSSTVKYAQVIAKMEKKAQAETPETASLKVELAKRNAVLYAKNLMGVIKSRTMMLRSGIKGSSEVVDEHIRHVSKVSEEITKVLIELEKEIGSDTLEQRFKAIEESQKIDSMKANK